MSFAPTYLEQKKATRSPVSLGAALAINGAVLGALLFASPAVIVKGREAIETITLAPPPEPDPLPPPQSRERLVEQPAPSNPTTSTPVVPTTKADFELPSLPPIPQPGAGAIGTGRAIVPSADPPRESVFVGPQIDSRYVAALQPPYPPGKIRAEEEGVVVVRVLIGPDGRVKRVEKIEGDDAFFRATAAQATKRWRFKPATRDGVAVEGWRTMTVRFELDT